MSTYFEVKVKYEKLHQDGKQKRVNEPYLVDAVSFSDAEARINKVLEPYISGEFFINNMKIANYSDIIHGNDGKWFKCKISHISYDEKSGKEKKTNSYMLVEAETIEGAKLIADKLMESSVSDYEIPAINETKIQDVFEYEMSDDDEIKEGVYDGIKISHGTEGLLCDTDDLD
jgi:hypothetical protein